MSRQLPLSDVAAQRTLTECADTATESEDDDTPMTESELLDHAQQHAVDVAAEHFLSLPVDAIEWDILKRAKRQVGITKYDPETEEIMIVLTWNAFEQEG
ncbi:hypothetical protein [Haladaptatus halobius]|uniref:hypothetical protein n=1 Tax=Haladaptatus halobius TaxID=2884875 RepID=UPI001D0A0F6C|nr:hypothetical protein [Haladaptatus halobius]